MSYMMRSTMLLTRASTWTASFTTRHCRNTKVVDLARSPLSKASLTMMYYKIRIPSWSVGGPLKVNNKNKVLLCQWRHKIELLFLEVMLPLFYDFIIVKVAKKTIKFSPASSPLPWLLCLVAQGLCWVSLLLNKVRSFGLWALGWDEPNKRS